MKEFVAEIDHSNLLPVYKSSFAKMPMSRNTEQILVRLKNYLQLNPFKYTRQIKFRRHFYRGADDFGCIVFQKNITFNWLPKHLSPKICFYISVSSLHIQRHLA